MGVNTKNVICSGKGERLKQRQDSTIEWEESFNGIAQNDVYKEIASYFKGLRVTYCGLDENNIPVVTNDCDGLFFPVRYTVIEQDDGNNVINMFNSFDELAEYVSMYYGTTLSSPGKIRAFNDHFPNVRISEVKPRKTQYQS